jgi:hypothetical protein
MNGFKKGGHFGDAYKVGGALGFAKGGHVKKPSMTTSAMKGGNATVQRDKPTTVEDRVAGGKTPLRSGYKKGGKAMKK